MMELLVDEMFSLIDKISPREAAEIYNKHPFPNPDPDSKAQKKFSIRFFIKVCFNNNNDLIVWGAKLLCELIVRWDNQIYTPPNTFRGIVVTTIQRLLNVMIKKYNGTINPEDLNIASFIGYLYREMAFSPKILELIIQTLFDNNIDVKFARTVLNACGSNLSKNLNAFITEKANEHDKLSQPYEDIITYDGIMNAILVYLTTKNASGPCL